MSYTTAAAVRNTLPHLLIEEDIIGTVDSGTTITLTNPAFDVPTILQDSATLEKTTDFTFVRPRSVTLGTEASGEHYIATCYIGAADTTLETLITRADRIINTTFANEGTPDSDYAGDWSTWLAAAMFLREYATATEENLSRAKALDQLARDEMSNYKENHPTEETARVNYTYVVKANG